MDRRKTAVAKNTRHAITTELIDLILPLWFLQQDYRDSFVDLDIVLSHVATKWFPWICMVFSTEPIRQIGWFKRSENSPCLNHQPINSDGLEGAIRNPIQQEEVVGRALRGSVCSLASVSAHWIPFVWGDKMQRGFGWTLATYPVGFIDAFSE